MNNEFKPLREFGKCRLDVEKKFLWCGDQPVQLPLKAIELLCVLVEGGGTVVTKDEIWQSVWQNSFVEETNLTHNIYLLRKTFKDLGEPDLIQTVPRRGYRFAGEVSEAKNGGDIIIERHALSQTLIEVQDETREERETRGHGDAETRRRLGELESENKHRRVAVSSRLRVALTVLLFALASGFAVWRYQNSQAKTSISEIKSIAVLPLQNFSDNENEKTLSLGLTDTLITRLGGLNRFAVRPFSASQKYQAGETDALDFGGRLKVDAVLEGSLQTANNRLRVNVRLLRVADGSQIWAGSFDENETDIFKLQDLLSIEVAKSLTDRLTPQQQRQLASRPTEDFEAYQLYLRGRYAWNKRTPEDLRQSLKFYQAAIDREPTFAHAYAGLADSYSLLGDGIVLSPHDAYPKAKAAALRALEINENLAEAHTSLAWVLQTYEWNWAGAEREYRRAIELNPNYATAHQWYAEFLMAMGRHEEAIAEIRRAKEIDPLSTIISAVEGWILFHARDYDRSIEQYRKTIELESTMGGSTCFELEPKFTRLWDYLARIYEQKEDYENAIAAHRKSIELKGGSAVEQDALKEAYTKFGVKGYWEKRLEMLQKPEQIPAVRLYSLVEIYVRLGDKEKAFALLEKSLQEREYSIINLKVSPSLDNLRDEPRYREMLRKMNPAEKSEKITVDK